MTRQKETDVGRTVVSWLRDLGWTVYQEVIGIHADIVAVQERYHAAPLVWIIECKTSLNLKVICQAIDRSYWAHRVSVAVPRRSFPRFAETILRSVGIGLLTVESGGGFVAETVHPSFRRDALVKETFKSLHDEQKTFCDAGSPGGLHWSPFKETCRRIREAVNATPGAWLRDVLKDVGHHYSNNSTAAACLAKWISLGKVSGVRHEIGHDRKFRLYPLDGGNR